MIWDLVDEFIVLLGVHVVGCQEFDDTTKCPSSAENWAGRVRMDRLELVQHTIAVIAGDDFFDQLHVSVIIANKDWTVNDSVVERLANLGLASTAHGAWLVAKGWFSQCSNQEPFGRVGMTFYPNLVSTGVHINVIRQQSNRGFLTTLLSKLCKGCLLFLDVEFHVLGQQMNIGKPIVCGVSFIMLSNGVTQQRYGLFVCVGILDSV
mmetsp:Transcript_38077/g.79164  ORF Transcript_38077/g.79164 Transcript_38077/m.79164 type:complete len:207 (+) Transcript_38077:1674-2294(+)